MYLRCGHRSGRLTICCGVSNWRRTSLPDCRTSTTALRQGRGEPEHRPPRLHGLHPQHFGLPSLSLPGTPAGGEAHRAGGWGLARRVCRLVGCTHHMLTTRDRTLLQISACAATACSGYRRSTGSDRTPATSKRRFLAPLSRAHCLSRCKQRIVTTPILLVDGVASPARTACNENIRSHDCRARVDRALIPAIRMKRLESTNGGVSLPRVIVELDQVTRHFRADIQDKQVHAITLLKRPFDCALVDGVHVRSNARESDLPLRKIPYAKNGSDTFGFVPLAPSSGCDPSSS
jgi:hypothetical protein